MNKMNQENKQKEYMNKVNKLFSQTLRGSYASKNVVIKIKRNAHFAHIVCRGRRIDQNSLPYSLLFHLTYASKVFLHSAYSLGE